MALRVIALLVAVVMTIVGATSPVDVPVADDLASAVDATPDVAVPPAIVAIAIASRVAVVRSDVPSGHAGRFHAVTVFRPPRSFASR